MCRGVFRDGIGRSPERRVRNDVQLQARQSSGLNADRKIGGGKSHSRGSQSVRVCVVATRGLLFPTKMSGVPVANNFLLCRTVMRGITNPE